MLNLVGVTGTMVLAQAQSIRSGVLGRILMGVGMSANLMGTLKLIINWFDLKRFATLSGLVLSLGALGSVAATSPMALMVQELGWRRSFHVLAGFNTLLIICVRPRDSQKSEHYQ